MLIRVHLGTPATETLHLLKHMEAPPICYILQAVLASFARTCAFSSAHAKKQTKARHRLLCKSLTRLALLTCNQKEQVISAQTASSGNQPLLLFAFTLQRLADEF